jgi:hypothetical protein
MEKVITKSEEINDGFMNIILTHRPVHSRNLLRFSSMTCVWKVPCSNLGLFVKNL